MTDLQVRPSESVLDDLPVEGGGAPATLRSAEPPERRRARPIRFFAIVGAFFIGLQVYAYSGWLAQGPERAPNGGDPLPDYMRYWSWFIQVAVPVLFVLGLYHYVIKTKRRDGRIHFDGLMYLAACTMYWADPYVNYLRLMFTENTHYFEVKSWLNFLPGVQMANADQYAEGPLWVGPVYALFFIPGMVLTCWVMKKMRIRYPRLGNVGVLGIGFFWCFSLDVIIEWAFIRVGSYAYPHAISWISLSAGTYYQFPLYEAKLAAVLWIAMTSVRFFRNDKGETYVERGLDDMKSTPAQKQGLRFLALTGAFNLFFVLLYILPMGIVPMQANGFPDDFDDRSYLRSNICGDGTDYACSDGSIPVPLNGSSYVNNEGELVVPGDADDTTSDETTSDEDDEQEDEG